MNLQSKNIDWKLPLFIYLLVNGIMLFFHEPWRDELQSVLVAQESNSIIDLFSNARYEGHPSLWYLILFVLTRFTSSIPALQIMHLTITAVGVFLILRYASIPKIWKILIIFGYYFSYEYSILFRNYSIGITLLFAACVFIQKDKLIWTAVMIFLALQTNLFALIVGSVLWVALFLKYIKPQTRQIVIGSFIIITGIILSLLDTVPPKDYGFANGYNQDLIAVIRTIPITLNAFLPIPYLDLHFWNTNIINKLTGNTRLFVQIPLILIITITIILYLRRAPKLILFFLLTSITIIAFCGIKYHGYNRHHGHIFIAFIIAIWLKDKFQSEKNTLSASSLLDKIPFGIITVLLCVQIITVALMWYQEIKYPFSRGIETGKYIRDNGYADYFLMGHAEFSASMIAYELNKNVYHPVSNSSSKYITWDNKRNVKITHESLINTFVEKRKEYDNVLLIMTFPLENDSMLNLNNIKLIKEFKPSVIPRESYYLYTDHVR